MRKGRQRMVINAGTNIPTPPHDTVELRNQLTAFLGQSVVDPWSGKNVKLGGYKFGVYAFFDYDKEPIYVGQTNERLGSRIRRHLTNQRSDAVAMKVLDPFEVYEIEVWPLPEYQRHVTSDEKAKEHLDWLEYYIYQQVLKRSQFQAVLNEKEPPGIPAKGRKPPQSWRGKVVSQEVFRIRNHPDLRIARRAETLSLLAKVISERQVKKGLRRTLLTQAKRLAWLAERRLEGLAAVPESDDEGE